MEPEDTQEQVIVDIEKNMTEVKGAILGLAQANNSPATGNIARQICDQLDTGYALYRVLLGTIQAQQEQIDEAVETGNVVQFPGKERVDA